MTTDESKNFLINHVKGWKTFNSTNLALLNSEDTLVRSIDDVREHQFYPIARYLQHHADPKNSDKSAVVAEPEVDHQTIPGTWRHLSCYMVRTNDRGEQDGNGKHFNLVQELRRGFLTTLPENEARMENLELLPGSTITNTTGEKTFALRWTAVDPDLMESLAKGKLARGVVAELKYRRAIVGEQEEATVTVGTEGVGASTTWAFKMIRAEAGKAEDGTGVVTVVYSDSDFTVTDWSNWGGAFKVATTHYYRVIEAELQSTINGLEGAGKSVSHSRGNDGFCTVTVRANDYAEKDHAEGVGGWKVWHSIDGDVTYKEVKNASASTIAAVKAVLVTQADAGMVTSYRENVDQFGNVTLDASYKPPLDDTERDDAEGALPDAGWKEWESADGTVTYRSVKNASAATIAAVKATLATQAGNGLSTNYSESVDRFGNVSLNASYRPQRGTFGSTNWENYADKTYTFPEFTDQYGTVHRAFKVYIKYSSQAICWTHQQTSQSYGTYVPSYRGWKSEVKRMGKGRWVSVRVEVLAP